MKNKITALLLLLVPAALIAAEIKDLGKLTVESALVWDPSEKAEFYNIYVQGGTNIAFRQIATVATNRWAGSKTEPLNGWMNVRVTAVNGYGESDPSETVRVEFRAGVPLPPSRLQIYRLVQLSATNDLPASTNPPSPTK